MRFNFFKIDKFFVFVYFKGIFNDIFFVFMIDIEGVIFSYFKEIVVIDF